MALLHVGASPVTFTDYALHSHDCYEIILNKEGTGTALIADHEYPFTPGTIHIIPPDTKHTKYSEGGFRDIYIHTDTLQPSVFSGKSDKSVQYEPILLSDDPSGTAAGLMSILLSRYITNGCADDLTETLFDTLLRLIGELRKNISSDPVINDLLHAIADSYSDPEFQVTEALLATGYSKDYIRRRFHQAAGMTPNAYLRHLRIQCAKKLLDQKDMLRLSISDIASMSGFYDTAYFCRIFHRDTGMTPLEYARSAF